LSWSNLNEDQRERERAAARARYHRNKAADPDRVRQQSKASSRAHRARGGGEDPVVVRERVKKWAKSNPEKIAAKQLRRSRRKRDGLLTEDWIAVIEKDPCAYCGGEGGTIDHVIPLSRGGEHGDTNVVGACRRCNSSKSARPLLIFLLNSR